MVRGTILVVDDSPLTIEVMRRGLESAGFTVRTASVLDDVPRALAPGEVDLVLMDVEMAEAFGDDLAMLLRTYEAAPPIYLLSALEEHELAERADAAGVDGFIQKHAGIDALVRRVEEILGLEGGDDAAPAPGVRADLTLMFFETARRRARTAHGAVRTASRDDLRKAAYELHALVGEAAVLGFTDLARLAQEGRAATARCQEQPGAEARRACAEILASIEERVEALATSARSEGGGAAGTSAPRNGRRVLLLDDSDVFRATLRAILEDSGYDVIEAASCAEGRQRLTGDACDVVICDVELQDGSGVDLIPEVRSAMPRAAVVVLSGGDVLTVPSGADLVLLKTLDPTTVLAKIERLLR